MKTVSIQDLKARLSAVLAEAAAGVRVLITRHRKPIAVLAPPDLPSVHVGKRYGKARFEPLLSNATGGRYLEVLGEDRRDER